MAVIAGVGQQGIDRAQDFGQGIETLQGRGDLLLVIGVVGGVLLNDEMRCRIDPGLCVIGLLEAAAGGGYDARLGIGEVDLVFWFGPGLGYLRRLAAGADRRRVGL
nr:hypothetical protein [uncultured Thiohalocapsa sp.]